MSVDSTITVGGVFRVGDVLARTWKMFIGNFLFFIGISLVVYVAIFVPVGVFILLFVLAGVTSNAVWLIAIGVLLALLLFVSLNTIGAAVLLFGAFQRLRGQPLRVGDALQRALARFFPLVGLGILWSLGIMLGTLLLIVPGVILFCMWAVVVPVCIVEGLGPIESMSRSAALTKGYRWQVFALVLILSLINAIGSQFVELALSLLGEWASGLGGLVWLGVWNGLWNCGLIMIYHDLRTAKEGFDIEQVAAIFD